MVEHLSSWCEDLGLTPSNIRRKREGYLLIGRNIVAKDSRVPKPELVVFAVRGMAQQSSGQSLQ